ncbi:fimbria/pilus outer membrane usher protein [Entomohabitans teleogrylli]|uniref:fimbria/pilus outer membrane usher protein n=1 Tax=Entomohabitans teleogrylli TaxID=1384589 RepID=UPI00073D5674|nr:fimbria/pilus outer membrane usher protein [Entomohabitans teleogrylli]
MKSLTHRYSPVVVALVLAGWCSDPVHAEEVFNVHALELDDQEQGNVDLSWFTRDGGQAPGTYHVTISINDRTLPEIRDIRFVKDQQNNQLEPELTPGMLKAWGVNIAAFPALANIPEDSPIADIGDYIPLARSEFQIKGLILNISIPQAAMVHQARGWVDPQTWDDGITAGLLNYSFTGANSWHNAQGGAQNSYYANLQSGFNFGPWRLRNYSTWNYDNQSGSQWHSLNTYLQRDIKFLRSQLVIGDSTTAADIFDSVQFRGIQLFSDDNMLPDSERGFAPRIRGIAQSNAQVTIRQNGNIIDQRYVPPGPFSIDDLYPGSGSGDLEVTIKEADGSESTFIQPFAAVPIMQRQGQVKYALTAGKYRSSGNNEREPEFGQAGAIYGVSNYLTLYGGLLGAADYYSAALGAGVSLGPVGSISLDVTAAHTRLDNNATRDGQSYRLQYAKQFPDYGTSFSLAAYRYSTAGFYTFEESNQRPGTDNADWELKNNKRAKFQLDISQNVNALGSFYLSAYQQSYWNQSGEERTLTAGWSTSLGNTNISMSYSYSSYPQSDMDSDRRLAINFQIPLDSLLPRTRATYSVNSSKHGSTSQQIGLNGTALADNNLSWGIRQSYTNQGNGAAGGVNADYRGTYGEATGAWNYGPDNQQITYGLKGGVVAHSDGITFSQPLGQSVTLVKAPHAANAKVLNNTGVYTDWRGYTVVPYASPYKNNSIALDTSMIENVDLENAVKQVTPGQGAVVVADFAPRLGYRVLMSLMYQGRPLPFGAVAKLDNGGEGIVGDDGQVYLTGVPEQGVVSVEWRDKHCAASYDLTAQQAQKRPVLEINGECR